MFQPSYIKQQASFNNVANMWPGFVWSLFRNVRWFRKYTKTKYGSIFQSCGGTGGLINVKSHINTLCNVTVDSTSSYFVDRTCEIID